MGGVEDARGGVLGALESRHHCLITLNDNTSLINNSADATLFRTTLRLLNWVGLRIDVRATTVFSNLI